MKTIVSLLVVAAIATLCSGCAANATVGNHAQHGAGVSAKTEGAQKGVHAKVY